MNAIAMKHWSEIQNSRSVRRIGIVGGGQLAAMLVEQAQSEGMSCLVLATDMQCPAARVGADVMHGSPTDAAAVQRLAESVDVVTVELEHVSLAGLAAVEASGTPVFPDVRSLRLTTNKLEQKRYLAATGVPTLPFQPYDGVSPVPVDTDLGWPLIHKIAEGGYDGRGVALVDNPNSRGLGAKGYLEPFIEDVTELAVMVAKGADTTVAYEPVELEMDKRKHVLRYLIAPARVSQDARATALALAKQAVSGLSAGVYGVEMFLTKEGELLVNEISPRTHNSGHHTQDACDVSQFEQQRRILAGLEPIAPTQLHAAVTFNLLGAPGFEGTPRCEGIESAEADPDVHLHWYHKVTCFPYRKMAHVTVIGDTPEATLRKARPIDSQMAVYGNAWRRCG